MYTYYSIYINKFKNIFFKKEGIYGLSKKERIQNRDVNHHMAQKHSKGYTSTIIISYICYASEPCGGSHPYLASFPFETIPIFLLFKSKDFIFSSLHSFYMHNIAIFRTYCV